MTEQMIICPKCKVSIPLTEALTRSLKDGFQKEYEASIKEKEEELLNREKEIAVSKVILEQEMAKKLEQETAKLAEQMKQKAEQAMSVQLQDLRNQLEEKDSKIKIAQEAELKLRKQQRELEEKQKDLELEVTRKIDEEREQIANEVRSKTAEEHTLKLREREKQIKDLQDKIEELKRKSEQGSQKLQGEVLELELEDILKTTFPYDQIEPVPSGIKGADVVQAVLNRVGKPCGTILWEAKRTKAWNDEWVTKLKDDQIVLKAEIAIIVTTALPKEINNFGLFKGVWVTDFSSAISLATAIRLNLIQIAELKQAAVGKNEKMELIYNYLSGPEFRQKVEAIVESFVQMKSDLDNEKRAFQRQWAKREKQIERVINNTANMYGDLQGIIGGASLPEIKSLELKELTSAEIDLDDEVENVS